MESNKAESCLRTFLITSNSVLNNLDKQIYKLNKKKKIYGSARQAKINDKIEKALTEKNRCLGRYNAVVVEMLNAILKNPDLLDAKYIPNSHKYNGNVIQLVNYKKMIYFQVIV